MKFKITVDELPKSCEDCPFYTHLDYYYEFGIEEHICPFLDGQYAFEADDVPLIGERRLKECPLVLKECEP